MAEEVKRPFKVGDFIKRNNKQGCFMRVTTFQIPHTRG